MNKFIIPQEDIIKANFNDQFFFAQILADHIYGIIKKQPEIFDFLYKIKMNNVKKEKEFALKYFSDQQTVDNKIKFAFQSSQLGSKYDFSNIKYLSRFFYSIFNLFFNYNIFIILIIKNFNVFQIKTHSII